MICKKAIDAYSAQQENPKNRFPSLKSTAAIIPESAFSFIPQLHNQGLRRNSFHHHHHQIGLSLYFQHRPKDGKTCPSGSCGKTRSVILFSDGPFGYQNSNRKQARVLGRMRQRNSGFAGSAGGGLIGYFFAISSGQIGTMDWVNASVISATAEAMSNPS